MTSHPSAGPASTLRDGSPPLRAALQFGIIDITRVIDRLETGVRA
jgi:hypothetical protein